MIAIESSRAVHAGFAAAAAIALSAALALGLLWGCSSSTPDDGSAAVATVNGIPIAKSAVDDRMASYRVQYGVSDDESWSRWLADSGFDEAIFRRMVVGELVRDEVVRQYAEANGLQATDEEVEAELADPTRGNESWDAYLDSLGDEAARRDAVRAYLTTQRVFDSVVTWDDPTDEELWEAATTKWQAMGIDCPDESASSLGDLPIRDQKKVESYVGRMKKADACEAFVEGLVADADVEVVER